MDIKKSESNDERDVHRSEPVHCDIEIISRHMFISLSRVIYSPVNICKYRS